VCLGVVGRGLGGIVDERRAERLVRKKISKVLWLHTSINHTMRKRKV
jgi:hypothetical protein